MSGTPAVPGNSLETLPDCATVPVTSLAAELGEKRMGGRIAQGQDPVLRPDFSKSTVSPAAYSPSTPHSHPP
ncbi:hypothetical protein EKH77_00070 [Streptomyces luteoverticillatus]|uniref:Uncharacterized protein n=1 Tax=Streptomyces luteoverticillatus TaxID=66425 RepID=A0A3Q9FR26_STRLT|nr:hypothetical protein [Streptomyces luteoverticillatus]AZQ69832.1 hypothetical protein EKH77_00070 [Streptomyces luteoverticillatus]